MERCTRDERSGRALRSLPRVILQHVVVGRNDNGAVAKIWTFDASSGNAPARFVNSAHELLTLLHNLCFARTKQHSVTVGSGSSSVATCVRWLIGSDWPRCPRHPGIGNVPALQARSSVARKSKSRQTSFTISRSTGWRPSAMPPSSALSHKTLIVRGMPSENS